MRTLRCGSNASYSVLLHDQLGVSFKVELGLCYLQLQCLCGQYARSINLFPYDHSPSRNLEDSEYTRVIQIEQGISLIYYELSYLLEVCCSDFS
jgi:hypothetical protein